MSDDGDERVKSKVSIPINVLVGMLSALFAGGFGSAATGWSVSSNMREGYVRIEAQVQALHTELRRLGDDQRSWQVRSDARAEAFDKRLRDLELWQARTSAGK